jgi:hypothetical protein
MDMMATIFFNWVHEPFHYLMTGLVVSLMFATLFMWMYRPQDTDDKFYLGILSTACGLIWPLTILVFIVLAWIKLMDSFQEWITHDEN